MKDATLQAKVQQVNEVSAKMKESESLVFVNVIGLTVEDTMKLRKELYDNKCSLHVVKNNILRRSSEECGYEGLDEVFTGPNAVAFSPDVNSASKVIYNFAKKNPGLVIKAGVVDGKVLSVDEVKTVATLPDKNGMLSMLLSVLQAPIRNFAYAVKAIGEKAEGTVSE